MLNNSFDGYLEKKMKEPKFKEGFLKEYDSLTSALALVQAREDAGLSQRQLAELASVPQSTVARIEGGGNTSVETLAKLGNAMGKRLKVSFD